MSHEQTRQHRRRTCGCAQQDALAASKARVASQRAYRREHRAGRKTVQGLVGSRLLPGLGLIKPPTVEVPDGSGKVPADVRDED